MWAVSEKIQEIMDFEIDLVYTWVDGNDPEWKAKHDAFTGGEDKRGDSNCKGRYADNDELRYSLRSIATYAPWIHRIFIVTDNQVPEWLNLDNDKIRIVDHKDFIPKEGLPCFNSTVIEHCMYRIPGLSEHFIYSNDDMFLNKPVTPATFFTEDGLPIVRMLRSPFRRFTIWFKDKFLSRPLSRYNLALRNSSRLVYKAYGVYMSEKTHHNIDAFLRSNFEHVANKFKAEFAPMMKNHLRTTDDFQRIIYSYVPIIEKRARREYVGKDVSYMLRIHHKDSYTKLEKYDPIFFCLNDSQYASDDDRERAGKFLAARFPEKSEFEK